MLLVSVGRNADFIQAILKRREMVIQQKGVCDENYEYRVVDMFFSARRRSFSVLPGP